MTTTPDRNDLRHRMARLPAQSRWRDQPFPAPIVITLVRDPDGRQLLIRRKVGPYSGLWAMVGGKWDFGEPLAEAARREVWEETGLETRFVALRAVVSERMAEEAPEGHLTGGAHFLLLICELAVEAGEAAEQNEGLVAWFGPAELEALAAAGEIIPSDYAMLQQFGASETAVPLAEVVMRATLNSPASPETSPPAPQMVSFDRLDPTP